MSGKISHAVRRKSRDEWLVLELWEASIMCLCLPIFLGAGGLDRPTETRLLPELGHYRSDPASRNSAERR